MAEVRCTAVQALPPSMALPDSHWLRIDGDTIQKISPLGEPVWVVRVPGPEPLASVLSVADNGTLYVRTRDQVMALGSDGKWLWRQPAPIEGVVDQSHQPAAMTDSGVVFRAGPRQYRAYAHTGELRWKVDVDVKGGPSEQPMILRNGSIIVRGSQGLIAISPRDGSVEWGHSSG